MKEQGGPRWTEDALLRRNPGDALRSCRFLGGDDIASLVRVGEAVRLFAPVSPYERRTGDMRVKGGDAAEVLAGYQHH